MSFRGNAIVRLEAAGPLVLASTPKALAAVTETVTRNANPGEPEKVLPKGLAAKSTEGFLISGKLATSTGMESLDPDERLPHLGTCDVDDEDLAATVDRAIDLLSRSTPYLVRLREEVRLQQDVLRVAFPESWQQYLAVEEAENTRLTELILAIVRWGWSEGARSVHRGSR